MPSTPPKNQKLFRFSSIYTIQSKNKTPNPQMPQSIQSKPPSLQARYDNTATTNSPHRDATAMIPITTCEIMVTAFINSSN
jgi:hypothetical protein